jgi:membrane associated rhomboid family serine protease
MATATQTCYRHPDRETGVSCSSCGRPICPDCMTPTPVGMRCPECARQKTQVRTMSSVAQTTAQVTTALIVMNAVAFLATGNFGFGGAGSSALSNRGALFGPSIAEKHEFYRLVTSGFLHAGIIHIGFNMYLLYLLGQMLEPALGSVRFALIYVVALLSGSLGALILSPDSLTVGASGAVFGLMGAAFFEMRNRGIDPMQSGIGPLILFNLVFSFVLSNISIGGHIGGLIGGSAAILLLHQLDRGRAPKAVAYGALAVVAVAVAIASVAVAESHCSGDPFCKARATALESIS